MINSFQKLNEKFSYHKTGFEMLKYLKIIEPSAIPISILDAIVEAAFPYISILLSSKIIDLLINHQYKNVFIFTSILIISNFITGMIIIALKEVLSYKQFMIDKKFIVLLRKKALELDYITMTNTDVLDDINYTERMVKYHGGLKEIMEEYINYLTSAISIITASTLVVLLCIAKPKSSDIFFGIIASPFITIILILFLLIIILKSSIIISAHFESQQKNIMEKDSDGESQLAYMMNEIFHKYSTGKIIRIFNMQHMILDKYDKWSEKNNKIYINEFDSENNEKKLNVAITSLFSILSYSIVIIKILTKAISIGSFTKYTGALIQLNNNIINMIKSGSNIKRRCDYLKYFISFMNLKNVMTAGNTQIENKFNTEYELEFHDVSFNYPNSDVRILNHVNFKLKSKDKVAIVGENGAGKSTFIKLLCRLYDPTEGVITLNGVDIKKYDYNEYKSLFSVVFQDFKLFAFPIGENLSCDKHFDDNKVWECLKSSGIKDSVFKMELKLNTPLYKCDDNGIEISGGEAQKIAISRALYKDAPFVILDEPTAALDPLSEQEIYSKFAQITYNKTSIFITHRMSSCCFCNNIIVFDRGEIVEQGSHNDLLKRNKYYAKLWNSQCKYYN